MGNLLYSSYYICICPRKQLKPGPGLMGEVETLDRLCHGLTWSPRIDSITRGAQEGPDPPSLPRNGTVCSCCVLELLVISFVRSLSFRVNLFSLAFRSARYLLKRWLSRTCCFCLFARRFLFAFIRCASSFVWVDIESGNLDWGFDFFLSCFVRDCCYCLSRSRPDGL